MWMIYSHSPTTEQEFAIYVGSELIADGSNVLGGFA
jgi:hypothetical protein